MKAWLLTGIHDMKVEKEPLVMEQISKPEPSTNEILIRVSCCGICHTEIDEIEGRTPPEEFPVVPGHQIIGIVDKMGSEVTRFKVGDRVGVAWIYSTCGHCEHCKNGMENLCSDFRGTGRDANGGYEEYMTIQDNFAYAIPGVFTDAEAAPLLCAGSIGYRSLRLANVMDGQVLGLTGFGSSGHLVLKMTKFLYPDSKIIVFARSKEEQDFSRSLGADWAGNIDDDPELKAHAIIDTTPVWNTVVGSLLHLRPGGRLVINAIRKESYDIDSLTKINYQNHLWMEKEIKSVANITRKDVEDFLQLAAKIPIKPEVEEYPFSKANEALVDMKNKHIKGAKVLTISN